MGHLPPEQCPGGDTEGSEGSEDGHDHAHSEGAQDDAHADHAEMDHSQMDHSQMDHSQMDHGSHMSQRPDAAPAAAAESAVPARAFEGPRHAADAIWGAEAMASSRTQLARENGGMRTGSVLFERLEARLAADGGEDGYLWDMRAFHGGDVHRLVMKSEGEGEFGGAVEDAEIQALYSRAVGPFFDLQAGVRLVLEPGTRGHLVIGVEGLAPYMFHVDGALFVSDRGDLTARMEAEYDQRITQRLFVQPRIEIELSAQDIAEREIGAGITKIEPGVRMRYEFKPEFAPYIGLEYEAALGKTADIIRADGDDPHGVKIVIGLRTWF
ncbi:MAG: copper resistance protein B [Rhodobacteraceae bacterium]|nr:copper resistance protein B [Paracoccaceae bacterium]